MKKTLLFAAGLFAVNFAMAQDIATLNQTGNYNDNYINQVSGPATSSGSLAEVTQINGADLVANESDINQTNNSTFAPNPKNEAHVYQQQYAVGASDMKNGSAITQNGWGNGAVVDQRGSGNTSRILQTTDGVHEGGVHGALNVAYTTQNGSGHDSDVKQYGVKNDSRVNQTGADHNATITQVGRQNSSNLSQAGVNETATVTQNGDFGMSVIVQN